MARSFNGSSGNIVFNTIASQEGLSAYSYHLRFYRISGGEAGYGIIFQSVDSGGVEQHVLYNDNADGGWGLVFAHNRTGGGSVNGGWSFAYPTNNVWTDYVITYDGSSTSNDPTVYKNGVAISTTERFTPAGTLLTSDDKLYLGNRAADDLTTNGRIAEFAKWNRVLSASEAAMLGAGFSPVTILRGLVFYAPLIGVLSPEIDIVGGTTGTVSGGTGTASHPRIIYPSRPQIILPPAAVVAGQPTIKRIATVPFLAGSLRQRAF